jgi:hypothetical protein
MALAVAALLSTAVGCGKDACDEGLDRLNSCLETLCDGGDDGDPPICRYRDLLADASDLECDELGERILTTAARADSCSEVVATVLRLADEAAAARTDSDE